MLEGRGLLRREPQGYPRSTAGQKFIHGPEVAHLSSSRQRCKWSLLQTVMQKVSMTCLDVFFPSPHSVFELAAKSLPVFEHAHMGRRDQYSPALPPAGSRLWPLLQFSMAPLLDAMSSLGLFPLAPWHPSLGLSFHAWRSAAPGPFAWSNVLQTFLSSLPPHLF